MARLILCLVASLVAAYAWVAIAAAQHDGGTLPFTSPAELPASLSTQEAAGGVVWSRQPMVP